MKKREGEESPHQALAGQIVGLRRVPRTSEGPEACNPNPEEDQEASPEELPRQIRVEGGQARCDQNCRYYETA